MTAEIIAQVRKAAAILKKGGVILYPTDTVWGLGCDATNAEAVKRIYEIKHRAESKQMLVLVDSLAMLERHVAHVPDIAYDLIDAAVDPITIIFDKAQGLAPNLTDASIGVRLTREEFSAALCKTLRRPIVSTSANISGEPTPAIFSEITEEIRSAVDYIPDYRRDDTHKAKPSGIIMLHNDASFKIIR